MHVFNARYSRVDSMFHDLNATELLMLAAIFQSAETKVHLRYELGEMKARDFTGLYTDLVGLSYLAYDAAVCRTLSISDTTEYITEMPHRNWWKEPAANVDL